MTLRTYSGNQGDPDRDDVEQWLFNDAPRSLRLSAIGKIPELLDTLSVEASSSNTAKQVQAKLTEAKEVTAAVTEALNNFQGEAR